MKTVTITKDDVLTAIETEPLINSYFISYDNTDGSTAETCPVCVVGGTLRQAGLLKVIEPDIDFHRRTAFQEVCERVCNGAYTGFAIAEPSNWVAAVSVVWEFMNDYNSGATPEDLRWNIWEWAEENIPEDWEYELVVQGGVE